MADLPVDFKDDIMNVAMDKMRRWRMISHSDGTVSFVDATVYDQIGSDLGAAQFNATNEVVNNLSKSQVETVDPMTATEEGFAADAKLTGDAIKELNANFNPVEILKETVNFPSSNTMESSVTIENPFLMIPKAIIVVPFSSSFTLFAKNFDESTIKITSQTNAEAHSSLSRELTLILYF